MKKRKILLLFIMICSIFFVGCTLGQSQEEVIPDYVLTYAENHPEGYATTESAHKFAELVEKRTQGKVKIQVKPNGEFGPQQQIVNQMRFGGVDFARVSISSLADALPILNVLQLPFLYEDAEHMWKVLEGEIGAQFMDAVYELNLIPLSWYDAGVRSFYSREVPIQSVEDIQGLTIRVQESQMMRDMITLLGGNAVDLAYSEVYSAFEIGKIDAAENSWSSYKVMEHYKIAKYYTLDGHTRVPEIQLASGETWSKLPKEYQQIILECAKESAEYEKELWKEQEEKARTDAIAEGVEEIVISEAELQKFQEKIAPLYEQYCAEYMELVEKIRSVRKKEN